MSFNEYPPSRKLSTNDQKSTTNLTSNQSSPTASKLTHQTPNETSNLPPSLERIPSEPSSPLKILTEDQQKSKILLRPEERPTPPKLTTHQVYNKEPEVFKADPLSPIAFLPTNQEKVPPTESHHTLFEQNAPEAENTEGLQIFGKYLEEYQKKFPSDVQHLRISRQLSSPESKKPEMYAFRRICNNSYLGETLMSEFIQGPLPDKESQSKSSKLSSNENLTNLSPPIDIQGPNQNSGVIQNKPSNQQEGKFFQSKDSRSEGFDSSASLTAEGEHNILRYSDMEALIRNQQKQARHPVRFNIMVAGESGLGKSTFIDCFLETGFEVGTVIRDPTLEIQEKEGTRSYNGITLKVTLIDTPGYTHSISLEEWYKPIKKNITDRFDAHKEDKRKHQRNKLLASQPIDDRRVHVILYFLSGPRIRGRDMQMMKNLQKYTSIIPILARGDSYTIEEIKEIKTQLIFKASNYRVRWFDFAEALKDSPEKLNDLNNGRLGPCPPFLVISSVNKVEIGPNQYVYGRKYEYGICDIENPSHSDFRLLQTLLGGHICIEAINLVDNDYYKKYHRDLKKKLRVEEEEKEKQKNLGIGAALALGALGFVLAFKKKFSS